jgi:hypothetical protein
MYGIDFYSFPQNKSASRQIYGMDEEVPISEREGDFAEHFYLFGCKATSSIKPHGRFILSPSSRSKNKSSKKQARRKLQGNV